MTNIELALEKLEAARIILSAVDAYQETCARLLAESSKLTDEVEVLLGEKNEQGTMDQDSPRDITQPC